MDMTSCIITPYLIYFGELGITPRVDSVQAEEILYLDEIPGRRLGEYLREDLKEDLPFEQIYEDTGYGFGIISRYAISHGHPHGDNVVVRPDNKPIIIDWGQAHYGIAPNGVDGAIDANGSWLLKELEEKSSQLGDRKGKLEAALRGGFERAFNERGLKPHEDIQRDAMSLMYGI